LDNHRRSELAAIPIVGTTHVDALRLFQDDDETDGIVMIGEMAAPRKKKPRRSRKTT